MKPIPFVISVALPIRLSTGEIAQVDAVGNLALLDASLLSLLASRECPGHVLLETLEQVPLWVQARKVIVSGFHSPLEQQVLRSVLRRDGKVVKVLAHGFQDYLPEPNEHEALSAGQMLIISAYPPSVTRTTRATALERNRLVLALASECFVPHISAGSPLKSLLAERPQPPART
jgi:predicted Rossmann fold nucleotide-binding protein DprA/Smf involved in DNA uptake